MNESVGPQFREDLITAARNQTLEIIQQASSLIRPGMSEDDGRALVRNLLLEKGCEKSWHAPQVRFGVNTLRAFGEPGTPGIVLQADDIYFLDLGPIFSEHEGDVARTFVVGSDIEKLKIAADAQKVWNLVRNRWVMTQECGTELYSFAKQTAEEFGWILSLYEANGHRIADFPHVAKQRSSIEALDFKPSKNRWILEIHIKHPNRHFGAFFEDLLQ